MPTVTEIEAKFPSLEAPGKRSRLPAIVEADIQKTAQIVTQAYADALQFGMAGQVGLVIFITDITVIVKSQELTGVLDISPRRMQRIPTGAVYFVAQQKALGAADRARVIAAHTIEAAGAELF